MDFDTDEGYDEDGFHVSTRTGSKRSVHAVSCNTNFKTQLEMGRQHSKSKNQTSVAILGVCVNKKRFQS